MNKTVPGQLWRESDDSLTLAPNAGARSRGLFSYVLVSVCPTNMVNAFVGLCLPLVKGLTSIGPSGPFTGWRDKEVSKSKSLSAYLALATQPGTREALRG